MTFIFKKKLNGNNELKVEYVLSSESNEIKVVQYQNIILFRMT